MGTYFVIRGKDNLLSTNYFHFIGPTRKIIVYVVL